MTDQEQLKALLDYNQDTGVFTWKKANGGRMKAGQIAGTIGDRGYIRIDVLGKQYPAHRLAWLYMNGCWPEKQIDHINLNKQDNRICNLRESTPSENSRNKSKRPDNTSGHKGVHKLNDKWAARCAVNGKRIYLGVFDTKELAAAAYQEFAQSNHGEFFRPH